MENESLSSNETLNSNDSLKRNDFLSYYKEHLNKNIIPEKTNLEINFLKVKKDNFAEVNNRNGYKLKLIEINDAVQGSSCTCPKKCYNLLSNYEKKLIFDNFWKIVVPEQQYNYLNACIKFNKVLKRKQKKTVNKFEYIVTKYNGETVQICKTAFLNLHGLKKYHIEKIRNQHFSVLANNKITKEIEEAKEFIRSTTEFKSCNKKRNVLGCYKKYLDNFENKKKLSDYKFKTLFKKEMNEKLNKMCRVCLIVNDSKKLFDIFSIVDDVELNKAIMIIAPIQIDNSEKNLPQRICEDCLKNLTTSINFRQLCIDSDKVLRSNTFVKSKEDQELKSETESINYENHMIDLNDENLLTDFKDEEMGNINDEEKQLPEEKQKELNDSKTKSEEQSKEKLIFGIDNIKNYRQYEYQKNKIVNKFGKKLGPPCQCQKKCYNLIGRANIKYIFHKYWNLKRLNVQSSYLHSCIVCKEVEERKKKDGHSRRRCTFFYRIKINENYIKVCQKAFLNMHGISMGRLHGIVKNILKTKIIPLPIKLNRDGTQKPHRLNNNEKSKILQMDVDQENIIKDEDKKINESLEENIPLDMMPTFSCLICKKIFYKSPTLRNHKQKHNHFTEEELIKKAQANNRHKPNEKGQYVCSECGETYLDEKKYRNHWKLRHTGRKYTCEKCGEVFKKRYKLFDHQYKHTGVRHLSCNICGRTYFNTTVLSNHKRLSHKNLLPYSCDLCGKSFAQDRLLVNHVSTKHKILYFSNQ